MTHLARQVTLRKAIVVAVVVALVWQVRGEGTLFDGYYSPILPEGIGIYLEGTLLRIDSLNDCTVQYIS
jgi:hypothetical protein